MTLFKARKNINSEGESMNGTLPRENEIQIMKITCYMPKILNCNCFNMLILRISQLSLRTNGSIIFVFVFCLLFVCLFWVKGNVANFLNKTV